MKKFCYIIFFGLLLVFPSKISANCIYEKVAELKKIATNINYDYIYTEKDQNVQFQIRFTNLNDKIYIYDETNNKTYYAANQNEIILSNFNPGNQYKFSIKGYDSSVGGQSVTVKIIENGEWVEKTYITGLADQECNEILHTFYVNLPYYNKFYNDISCKNLEKYSICQKWTQNNLTYEQFKEEIEKIKNVVKKEEVKKEISHISFTQEIIKFIKQYYYVLIIIITVIIIVSITLIRKRQSGFEGW